MKSAARTREYSSLGTRSRECTDKYCSEPVTDDDGRVKRCPKHRRVRALLEGRKAPDPLRHSSADPRVSASDWSRFRSKRNTSICPYCLRAYVSHGGTTKTEVAERQLHARHDCTKER